MNPGLWELTISLQGKSAWDPENKIGVVKNLLYKNSDCIVQEPPEAFGASQLYFIRHDDPAVKEQKLSYQFKKVTANDNETFEWTVCITPSLQPATVHVQDIKTLPEGVFVFWVNAAGVQDLKINDKIQIPSHNDNVYGYIVATSNMRDIALYQNSMMIYAPYPNPFRNSAAFKITVPYSWLPDGTRSLGEYRDIQLVIYDLGGRRIKTLLNGKIKVGTHYVTWNGDNEKTGQVPAGLYLARMRCDSFVKSVRLCRMR
jgi:hypothetical protein